MSDWPVGAEGRARVPRRPDSLEGERLPDERPALVLIAEPVSERNSHVGEDQLVERVIADDGGDAADFEAWGVRRHQQDGDAPVPLGLSIGADKEAAEVGRRSVLRPHLPTVDDVVVTDADGSSTRADQIGSGVRFGDALASVLVAPGY